MLSVPYHIVNALCRRSVEFVDVKTGNVITRTCLTCGSTRKPRENYPAYRTGINKTER
jgi:hypothetical protein